MTIGTRQLDMHTSLVELRKARWIAISLVGCDGVLQKVTGSLSTAAGGLDDGNVRLLTLAATRGDGGQCG